MQTEDLLFDWTPVDHFLVEIVDTREKLDVVVFLFWTQGSPETTDAIATGVCHPCNVVAEALCELSRASVVATLNDDGAGWWLDASSSWLPVVASVAELHAQDRMLLLRRLTRLALKRERAEAAGRVDGIVRLRAKPEPR